jgi:DNA-binding MarR family transcriptional regulator
MPKPRWLDARQAAVWRAYLDLHQHLLGALEDGLQADAGLSGADYTVLVALSEAPDKLLRAREICTQVGWDRSRLSHQLSRMEKRGLVGREECTEDGRGLMVRLTDAGRVAIEGAAPGHVELTRRYFFDLLSKQELDTLAHVFDRLVSNLAAQSTSD